MKMQNGLLLIAAGIGILIGANESSGQDVKSVEIRTFQSGGRTIAVPTSPSNPGAPGAAAQPKPPTPKKPTPGKPGDKKGGKPGDKKKG